MLCSVSSKERELRPAMLREFDLVPDVQGAASPDWRRRKKEAAKAKKRVRANRCLDDLTTAYNESNGNMTEQQAVSIAILGVSVWSFLLRLFLTQLAQWVLSELRKRYPTTDNPGFE